MLEAIFDTVSKAVAGFSKCLADSFTSIGGMFYSVENGMTFLGTLALIGAGVGLIYFAYRTIKGLIHRA